jgi:hypothetical protein
VPHGPADRLPYPRTGVVVEQRLIDLARQLSAEQVAQGSHLGAVAFVHWDDHEEVGAAARIADETTAPIFVWLPRVGLRGRRIGRAICLMT